MIRIFLGNIGSGKTASAVYELMHDHSGRTTFSNIKTTFAHQIDMTPDMVIKKTVIEETTKRDGSVKQKFKYGANAEFWLAAKKKYGAINVLLDEAHSIVTSRRSMSNLNLAVLEFTKLARRVIDDPLHGEGYLTFITQLPMALDTDIRQMAHQVRYHWCMYKKRCKRCGAAWHEHSDMAVKAMECLQCGKYELETFDQHIRVFLFSSMQEYMRWNMQDKWPRKKVKRAFAAKQCWFDYFDIHDISTAFDKYDTHQWENLITDVT